MATNMQEILSGGYFSLDEESGLRFRLRDTNWNDYGYYTLYSLVMQLPTKENFTIADMHIMNHEQKIKEKPVAHQGIVAFISNVASAEKLFLMLSSQQRLKLEEALHIRYDSSSVANNGAFRKSVCRNQTVVEFIYAQKRIRELMHSDIDVLTILNNHSEQICQLLSSLTKQS